MASQIQGTPADNAFTDNRGEAATLSGNGIGTVSSPRLHLDLGASQQFQWTSLSGFK
jgi:hypothetical protein